MQLFGNSEWLILMTAIIGACGDKQMEAIKRVRLSEIAELITKGTTPTTLGYNFQADGVNFLKIECFSEDGTYIKEKTAHISEECHEKLKRSKLRTGDILFSIAGAIGRVAVVTEEMLPANTNQALAIIRVTRDDIYLPYIKLILTSQIVKAQFERKKQGVAQLNISLKDINELEIPLPEKSKQIECASLLEKISGIITARQKQLQKLDKLIKARFVELFGDPQRNPHGYKHTKLSDIATYYNGLTYKPENVAAEGTIVLRSSNIQNSQLDFADTIRVDCAIKERLMVQKNDILMCSRNGSAKLVGKVALIKDIQEPMSFGAFMMIIRSHYFGYLMTYFQMDAFRQQIKTSATTTINQITGRMLDDVTIPLPPMALVDQFAALVEQTDKSKVAVQKALDEAQLLFDSLMQKYFG